MRQTSKGEGTKIAQAAKDLNVTSVTIRRYITEFDIETTTDENGVKVLPDQAMDELQEIRRLKEEGLTNPKVMELIAERRSKGVSGAKPKATKKAAARTTSRAAEAVEEAEEEAGEQERPPRRQPARTPRAARAKALESPDVDQSEEGAEQVSPEGGEDESGEMSELGAAGKAKHSLTCQTCGKVFEHMNPRLRDCLDCYRTKRRERRRGGSDKHKNVIQHPLAQQAVTKAKQDAQPAQAQAPLVVQMPAQSQPLVKASPVRNYRKAIEETRHITANLKRRLERPDLPEGDRRWLEQIYAYQLILHQGWRHLAEYRAGTHAQNKSEAREGKPAERGEDL